VYSYCPEHPQHQVSHFWVFTAAGTDPEMSMDDAQVWIDGVAMDSLSGHAPAVPSGDRITFRISDGSSALEHSAVVPGVTTDLALQGAAWDTSAPDAGNTITWTPSGSTCSYVTVSVYADSVHRMIYSDVLDATATSLTVQNSHLWEWMPMDSVLVFVAEVNDVSFDSDAGGRARLYLESPGYDSWPTSSARASGACFSKCDLAGANLTSGGYAAGNQRPFD
jgi:hypothetical protein